MIEYKKAAETAFKFSGLLYYPNVYAASITEGERVQRRGALGELICAIGDECASDAEADEFATAWVRANRNCPVPADVVSELREIRRQKALNKPNNTLAGNYECVECRDTGFTIIERNGMDFARPCQCRQVTA